MVVAAVGVTEPRANEQRGARRAKRRGCCCPPSPRCRRRRRPRRARTLGRLGALALLRALLLAHARTRLVRFGLRAKVRQGALWVHREKAAGDAIGITPKPPAATGAAAAAAASARPRGREGMRARAASSPPRRIRASRLAAARAHLLQLGAAPRRSLSRALLVAQLALQLPLPRARRLARRHQLRLAPERRGQLILQLRDSSARRRQTLRRLLGATVQGGDLAPRAGEGALELAHTRLRHLQRHGRAQVGGAGRALRCGLRGRRESAECALQHHHLPLRSRGPARCGGRSLLSLHAP